MLPSSLTTLAEIRMEWPKIIKRLPPHMRGLLIDIKYKRISLISDQFKYPIIAIEHEDFAILNKDIELLSELSNAITARLVNYIGGVKFIPQLTKQEAAFFDRIIDEFDAQIVNIEECTND